MKEYARPMPRDYDESSDRVIDLRCFANRFVVRGDVNVHRLQEIFV